MVYTPRLLFTNRVRLQYISAYIIRNMVRIPRSRSPVFLLIKLSCSMTGIRNNGSENRRWTCMWMLQFHITVQLKKIEKNNTLSMPHLQHLLYVILVLRLNNAIHVPLQYFDQVPGEDRNAYKIPVYLHLQRFAHPSLQKYSQWGNAVVKRETLVPLIWSTWMERILLLRVMME